MTIYLIIHVIIGLIGVMASYGVVMGLLKRELSPRFLKTAAFTAFLSYLITWISGGWYYIAHYTPVIRQIIKSGDSPWAHNFFMEAKEHIFLMLPVLAFTLWILLILTGERVGKDARLKNALIALSALITTLGIFIALSGVVISGAR